MSGTGANIVIALVNVTSIIRQSDLLPDIDCIAGSYMTWSQAYGGFH